MPRIKEVIQNISFQHAYCDSCQIELVLRTVTFSRLRYNQTPEATYEYMCPQCKRSYYLDKEYPQPKEL